MGELETEKLCCPTEEVSVLLQKAAIEQIPTSSLGPRFYSRLFLVPKKKVGMRPVIDLSIT
jgi:hypothetical protein